MKERCLVCNEVAETTVRLIDEMSGGYCGADQFDRSYWHYKRVIGIFYYVSLCLTCRKDAFSPDASSICNKSTTSSSEMTQNRLTNDAELYRNFEYPSLLPSMASGNTMYWKQEGLLFDFRAAIQPQKGMR